MKRLWFILVCWLAAGAPCAWPDAAASAAALARDAATALFVRSDLPGARELAAQALGRDPVNREALFVAMETAALEADTAGELDLAIRLCQLRAPDPRVDIAAAHIASLAANTAEFRAALRRIAALARDPRVPQQRRLQWTLIAAAEDGLPGLATLRLARAAGIVTDWTLAGPFGRFANVDFDRAWPPEQDGLTRDRYGSVWSERFQFDDGNLAVPDYFARGGVFYAAADIPARAPGPWRIEAESGGTLEIFVDGRSVLRKDDRFHSSAAVAAAQLTLAPGPHRILVKFLASATPLRVALSPALKATGAIPPFVAMPPAERRYVRASKEYWDGDPAAAVAELRSGESVPAPGAMLLANSWARIDAGAPEEITALHAAAKASPMVLAAQLRLAQRSAADYRLDEALARLRPVLAQRPGSAAAQELRSELAVRMHWNAEAADAMNARLRLQPSCSTLRDAAKFFAAAAQFDRAAEIERRMEGCAPGSLARAEALSDAGRHSEAAVAATGIVSQRPLDRDARAFAVRELRLAGDFTSARRAAEALAAIAPNSERFRRLARDPQSPLEDDDLRGSHFPSGEAFYSPYRREGLQVVRDTAARRFSGGPAVALVNDRVLRLNPDGSADAYTHQLIRVLNREGIERYGEVALDPAADLIELRTLKAGGGIVEPEFTSHKATVSMPALTPGDVVEQEYVLHYAAGTPHPEAFRFVFGSFTAPVLHSRFVLIAPDGVAVTVHAGPGAPAVRLASGGDGQARIWERDNIAQSVEETAMPRSGQFPEVQIDRGAAGTWASVRDYDRNLAIDAARWGARAQDAAQGLARANQQATARALYRFVTTAIRGSKTSLAGNLSPAEETLANAEGSRTAALLALARASGIPADLVLARDIGSVPVPGPSPDTYTRPLVRLWLRPGNEVREPAVVDAEHEGLAFGALPPTLDRKQALLVPLEAAGHAPEFVALPPAGDGERSRAQGENALDRDGNLSASVEIALGSWRSVQMRNILRGIPAAGRQHFFAQLAMRIFPGALDAQGWVDNENDFDRSLILHLRCRAPHFVAFNGGAADLDQIVPALGLRKMYANAGQRQFALYLDTPFFETTVFRVHLPPEIRVAQRAPDLTLHGRFGHYSVTFRQLSAEVLEITRAFSIPAQVVTAAEYGELVRFATQIDDAERQRLSLERVETAARR